MDYRPLVGEALADVDCPQSLAHAFVRVISRAQISAAFPAKTTGRDCQPDAKLLILLGYTAGLREKKMGAPDF